MVYNGSEKMDYTALKSRYLALEFLLVRRQVLEWNTGIDSSSTLPPFTLYDRNRFPVCKPFNTEHAESATFNSFQKYEL